MLPDWAPHVHPLLVHFPIALLVVAALVDGIGVVARRRHPWVQTSAVGLYALGALGVVAAFLTGRDASDALELPVTALPTLTAHADWALYLVWFASLYAIARVAALVWDRGHRLAVHLPLAAVGLLGLFLVQQTAERGGRLVFEHGVGVAAAEDARPDAHDAGMAGIDPAPAALDVGADGAWTWAAADGSLPAGLDVLAGQVDGTSLTATPGRPAFVALGEALGDLEARATLDLTQFTGTAMLVHHLRDADTYDFLAIETADGGPATVRQGRVANGDAITFAGGPAPLAGDVELKAYAVGTHFRGYADGDQITHGHGDAAPPGRVGIRLEGTGRVRLLALSATPVR